MYAIDWAGLLTRTHRNCSACATCPHTAANDAPAVNRIRRFIPAVSGTVWALGFTSLLTDVSSEMIASILPMYLVLELGMRPLAYGVIDGLYQGFAAIVRVLAGVMADRWNRHKEVAATGYALSALCRVALLAAGGAWTAIAGIVAIDRVGKGIRTAPRDALISLRSPCRDLATAFGVHRALDAAGAMLGPLVAFAILAAMPARFDLLFAVSFAIALAGVGVILLCVDAEPPTTARKTATIASAVQVMRTPGFAPLLLVGLVLGIPTISDAFVFLSLQRALDMGASAFPLMYVATSLFTALCSVPMGRLADKSGRTVVLIGGYAVLAVVYAVLLVPSATFVTAALALALLGAYYAATDGVLTAMAAAVLPKKAAGSGLSYLATVTNVSRLFASILFGLLWERIGIRPATSVFLVGLVVAIAAAAVVLPRARKPETVVA